MTNMSGKYLAIMGVVQLAHVNETDIGHVLEKIFNSKVKVY